MTPVFPSSSPGRERRGAGYDDAFVDPTFHSNYDTPSSSSSSTSPAPRPSMRRRSRRPQSRSHAPSLPSPLRNQRRGRGRAIGAIGAGGAFSLFFGGGTRGVGEVDEGLWSRCSSAWRGGGTGGVR